MIIDRVQPYFSRVACPDVGALSLMPPLRLPSAVHDERPIVIADINSRRWNNARWVNAHFAYDELFTLDRIFSLDSALVYYTEDVLEAQCLRSSYLDGEADPELPARPSSDEDAVDDTAPRRPAAPPAWPWHARRGHVLLSQPVATRGKTLKFPRPGTTYLVLSDYVVPEVLAQVQWPHAMGDVLSDDIMMRTGYGALKADAGRAALSVKYLIQYESKHDEQVQQQPTAGADMGYEPFFNLTDEEVKRQLSETEILGIVNREKNLTRSGLAPLLAEASACRYHPLLEAHTRAARVIESTATQMGTYDFRPELHLEQGSSESARKAASRKYWQPQIRSMLATNRDFEGDVDAFVDNMSPEVDMVDKTFVDRDDTVRLRLQHQAMRAALRIMSRKLHRRDPEAFCKIYWEQTLRFAVETHQAVMTSDNVPDAIKALRDFVEPRLPAAARGAPDAPARPPPPRPPRTDRDNRIKQYMQQRPFTIFLQELGDLLCGVKLASAQTYLAGMVTLLCVLDAWTWGPHGVRQLPGLNMLLAGKTGIGKSFIMNHIIKAILVPGFVRALTNVTTQAFNTDTSFDHVVFMFEEMKQGWLFKSSVNAKEQGSSDELNFFKQRMTAFYSETIYTWTDDATGRRQANTAKASHENVMCGGTNSNLYTMDDAVFRRFVVYYVARHIGIGEGDDVFDQNAFTGFCTSNRGRAMLTGWHELIAAYAYMSVMFKAAVVDDTIISAASSFQLDNVLGDLRSKKFTGASDNTKRHHVLQLSRNMQLLFACWLAFRSPIAHDLLPPEQQWDPAAMVTAISPFVMPGKEALIPSATMLDFEISPVHMEYVLRTIVTEVLFRAYSGNTPVGGWPFRGTRLPDGTFEFDGNYLVIDGRSDEDICDIIARRNREYELRKEDIFTFLSALASTEVVCCEIAPGPDHDPVTKRPHSFARLDGSIKQPRPVLAFEENVGKLTAVRGGRRLAILVVFLEQRLGFRMDNPASIEALRVTRRVLPVKEALKDAFLTQHATVGASAISKCPPVAAALMHKLSTPQFELDPSLAVWLDELPPSEARFRRRKPLRAPLPFVTAYVPESITVEVNKHLARNISFHGMHMLMHLKRDPDAEPLRRENNTRPLPTLKRNYENYAVDDEPESRQARVMEKVYGLVADTCDVDATFMRQWQRSMCHPGLPALDALFFRNTDVDPLNERPAIVPYGFGPVLNRIFNERAYATRDDEAYLAYPEANMRAKIDPAAALPKRRNWISAEKATGRDTFGGCAFSVDGEEEDDGHAEEASNSQDEEADMPRVRTFGQTPPQLLAPPDAMDIDS
jgi:hypothetical protein